MSQVQLDGPTIYKKLLKIHKAWNQVRYGLPQKIPIWRKKAHFWPLPTIEECIMDSILTSIFENLDWLKFGARRSFSGAGQNPGRRDPEVEHPGLFVSSTNFANLTFKLCVYSVWLLGYEFSDTLVLFTGEKVVFAVSQKKSKFAISFL